jgi:hypothetical protein
MTEAEWRTCADPLPMLQFLRGRASERQDRLFVYACARRVWHLIPAGERQQLEASAAYADGLLGRQSLRGTGEADPLYPEPQRASLWDFSDALGTFIRLAQEENGWTQELRAMVRREEAAQCALLRDVFGNPFHTPALPPALFAWNDGAVVTLARAIYDGQRFGDLPVLADALEEAGCVDPEVLAHCRGGGDHVRGCWVVDALLRRE